MAQLPLVRTVPSMLRRPATRNLLAVALIAASVWVVKGTSVGPVIAVVNADRGWGVHTGDALALPPAAAAAWLLLTPGRRRR